MSESPDFEPKVHEIANITNAPISTVTTIGSHGYSDGESVLIFVPNTYGMYLRYVVTNISVTGLATFMCDIDTQNMDTFVAPLTGTPAQVTPISGLHNNVATR